MSPLGTRSVHCIDQECDDCYSLTCSCSCHGGEDDDIYGWGDDD